MPHKGWYARGNREVGHVFDVMNFDADKFDQLGPDAYAFTQVFRWTVEDGIVEVHTPVYNTPSNTPVDRSYTSPSAALRLR